MHAEGPDDLRALLEARGQLLPLPKEPAALANVLEVGIVDHLIEIAAHVPGAVTRRGTERGYPDMELDGAVFGGRPHAVDIKVARRAATRTATRTESRITLCTGNTYFKWPRLHWPGTFRPYGDYASHLDVLVIYTLVEDSTARAYDIELIVQETWRIASRKRSSTTREYLGAVDLIQDLRDGKGEFATQDEFLKFWRAFPFKTSPQVTKQLERLSNRQQDELDRLRAPDPGGPAT